MSTRQKIWDVVSPFITLLLCLLTCTMVGTMAVGFLAGFPGLASDVALEAFPGMALVITIVCNILVCVLLRHSYRMDQARFGFDRNDWKPLKIAAAILLTATAGHLWSWLITATGIQNLFTEYTEVSGLVFQGQNPVLLTLTTVITAPIGEEVVFRAFIYRRAKNYLGPVLGAVCSSLLFGLYHANMVQFLYASVFGMLLVLLYEKSGSLKVAILAHAGTNLWAVIGDLLDHKDVFQPAVYLLIAEVVIALICVWLLFGKGKPKA